VLLLSAAVMLANSGNLQKSRQQLEEFKRLLTGSAINDAKAADPDIIQQHDALEQLLTDAAS